MSFTAVRRPPIAALLSAALLAVAGCGSDDAEEAADQAQTTAQDAAGQAETTAEEAAEQAQTTAEEATGGEELTLSAVEGSDGLGWDPKELSAPAGAVTIKMANPEGNKMPHAVSIEGTGVNENGNVVPPGTDTSTVTATLAPGEYTFYCPVGQHRQNGMEGTLTVE
jgi:plastocyanin